jgi:hypothetical protein
MRAGLHKTSNPARRKHGRNRGPGCKEGNPARGSRPARKGDGNAGRSAGVGETDSRGNRQSGKPTVGKTDSRENRQSGKPTVGKTDREPGCSNEHPGIGVLMSYLKSFGNTKAFEARETTKLRIGRIWLLRAPASLRMGEYSGVRYPKSACWAKRNLIHAGCLRTAFEKT